MKLRFGWVDNVWLGIHERRLGLVRVGNTTYIKVVENMDSEIVGNMIAIRALTYFPSETS